MTAAKKLPKQSIIEAFKPYESFCRAMLDAYAVVDAAGQVIKANQLLSQLVGLRTKQILKESSFDDCISFFVNDRKIPIRDLINSPAPTRIDEVRGVVSHDSNLNLIVGVYPFYDEETNVNIGAFLLIRDVTAETNLQGKYKDAANKSITDPLTGLFTRGYFEDYLNLQLSTIVQLPHDSEQRNLALVMVDIDFFKKVNDVHGHQAGDYILQRVAGVMKKCFRKTDVCCRYGGEEFLVILPATDLVGAMLASEKLRASVQDEKIEFEGKEIPITISSGVAQVKVGQESYSETMARADAALYTAKKSGRNRVCKAES